MAGWKRICCAVDLSDSSGPVLQTALDLAKQLGAELTLLHVLDTHDALTAGPLGVPLSVEAVELAARELEPLLAALQTQARAALGREVPLRVVKGTPARAEIVRAVEEGGFDAVVMGTHGRTGLAHLVMGSVAESVIREASCPVVVVRAPGR